MSHKNCNLCVVCVFLSKSTHVKDTILTGRDTIELPGYEGVSGLTPGPCLGSSRVAAVVGSTVQGLVGECGGVSLSVGVGGLLVPPLTGVPVLGGCLTSPVGGAICGGQALLGWPTAH